MSQSASSYSYVRFGTRICVAVSAMVAIAPKLRIHVGRFSLVVAGIVLVTMTARSQWDTPVLLTETPLQSLVFGARAIATSGDTLHVTWYDFRNQEWEIWYRRSINDGVTWGEEIRLTSDPANSFRSSIATAGSNVYVSWHDTRAGDFHVFIKRSSDGGETWSVDTDVSGPDHNFKSSSSAVAAVDNAVYVVWQELRGEELSIRFRKSNDYGESWGEPIMLSKQTGSDSATYPIISSSGPDVHVLWAQGHSAGAVKYQYSRSTDFGSTWDEPKWLAEKNSLDIDDAFLSHSIWATGKSVHALYQKLGNDGGLNLEYLSSSDGGTTWRESTTFTRLTHPDTTRHITSPGARYLSICGSDSTVHVAWSDLLPYTTPTGSVAYSYTLLYGRSTDGGATWQPVLAFGSDTLDNEFPHGTSSLRPHVVVSATATHLICHGVRGGYNVFYLRNPTGNLLSSALRVNDRLAEGSWSAVPQIFSDETRITFDLDNSSFVTVTIFDSRGMVVAQPLASSWIDVSGSAIWDGTRQDGSAAPSGQYFYRIDAGSSAAVGSVMLVR